MLFGGIVFEVLRGGGVLKLWLYGLLAELYGAGSHITWFVGKPIFRLQQIQLTGTGYSFGATLYLKFAVDFLIMPFNRIQGQEKPLANLTIRESLGNEL